MEGYVNVAEKCVVAGCDILLIPSDLIGRRLPKSTKPISLCFRTSKRRSVASVVAVLAQEPAAISVAEFAGRAGFDADPFEERLMAFYQDCGFDYDAYSSPADDEWEELLTEDWAEHEGEGLISHAQ